MPPRCPSVTQPYKRSGFKIDEKVYVFNKNGFDIYEAIIRNREDKRVYVVYPDWPDDEDWVTRKHVIPVTPHNISIFLDEQRIRRAKEEDEEDESEGGDAYESDHEKKHTPAANRALLSVRRRRSLAFRNRKLSKKRSRNLRKRSHQSRSRRNRARATATNPTGSRRLTCPRSR
jgi:hypothetical protein